MYQELRHFFSGVPSHFFSGVPTSGVPRAPSLFFWCTKSLFSWCTNVWCTKNSFTFFSPVELPNRRREQSTGASVSVGMRGQYGYGCILRTEHWSRNDLLYCFTISVSKAFQLFETLLRRYLSSINALYVFFSAQPVLLFTRDALLPRYVSLFSARRS